MPTQIDEHLYHVTYAGRVGSIGRLGLLPGHGDTFGGGYLEHSLGRLFLTDPDGVFFWHHRLAEQFVPIERPEEMPVVMRFLPNDEDLALMEADPIGAADARAPAYMTESDVEPDRIELWDGEEWVPVTDIVEGDLVDIIEDSADWYEEDGEEWVEYDEDVLLPPELAP